MLVRLATSPRLHGITNYISVIRGTFKCRLGHIASLIPDIYKPPENLRPKFRNFTLSDYHFFRKLFGQAVVFNSTLGAIKLL